MEVLILSKTHMNGGHCCIGGITGLGRYVRLLTSNGENQPENTEINPKQVWDIEFVERQNNVPPHVEDVLVTKKNLIGTIKEEVQISNFIRQKNIPIWRGTPDNLFDGLIQFTSSGSGYIDRSHIPEHSVGFWISDRNLTRNDYNGIRYRYPSQNGWRSLKFVGFEDPIDTIPAGTLIRVSLARWWKQNENAEERCFLQLSGWYDL